LLVILKNRFLFTYLFLLLFQDVDFTYVTDDVTVDACTVSRDPQVVDEHKPYAVIF